MKSALIHGVLLAVMLVYGYRTWTRDKTVKPDLGSVVLWNKSDSDLVAIEYKTDKKTVRLDHKDGYWWGTETSIEKKPKPKAPEPKKDEPKPEPAGSGSGSGSGSAAKPAAGSGSGSGSGSAAGSGSGSATPPTPPPPPEMVETTKKVEFPLGDGGDKIVKGYTEARAVRELESPTAEQLIDYKLADKQALEARLTEIKKQLDDLKAQKDKDKEDQKDDKTKKPDKTLDNKISDLTKKQKDVEDQKRSLETVGRPVLTITFKDGSRTFKVGGSVYGQSDRYVMDTQSNTAYVFSKDIIANLEVGASTLQLGDAKGFDATKIDGVEIDWNGRKKLASRIQSSEAEKQVKTWGDADTKKPNAPLATFIDNVNNLKPTGYFPDVKVDGMQPIVKLTYKDATGGTLGSLALYKIEKPGVLPEGQELDPANPPKGEIEYYVVSEKTRVPALVHKDTAQRSENDLPIVFGDKAAPTPPTGNPFGNVPIPPTNPHGGSPPGGLPPPAGGSANPLTPLKPGAGSAVTPGAGSANPLKPGAGSATVPKAGAGSAVPKAAGSGK